MISGIVSVLIGTVIFRSLTKKETFKISFSFNFLLYIPWLLFEITKSSINIASAIWALKLDISPSMRYIDTKLKSSSKKIIYASSITLTPGTVTLDLRDNTLLVHALDESGLADLEKGRMEQRIKRI